MDSKLQQEREVNGGTPFAEASGSLPRGPWVASNQYGMHFVLSQDNEILWRCDWLPMETLRAMVKAANDQMAANTDYPESISR